MKAKALVVMFCTLSAAVARAHVNNVPAVARYTSPLGPVAGSTDGGVTIQPYSPAVADQTFRITWEDGDQDPTGNFTFYYLSYQPHYQLDGNYLAANSEPLIAVGETQAAIRWVSCICEPDLGIACPDAGARPCANEVVWDTSLIEPGAYWGMSRRLLKFEWRRSGSRLTRL